MEGNSIELTTSQNGGGKKTTKIDKIFKQSGVMPKYVRELYGFDNKGEKNATKTR